MTGPARAAVIAELADVAAGMRRPHPVRIAIDGRTASGKTTLADQLAHALVGGGRPVIRTSIDGFHRPRAERYARGRYSAEGYYHDARDLDAVRRLLLDPLGPGGDRSYRTAAFDLERDLPLETSPQLAAADSLLIVDGTFLQRPELASGWDLVVFVDAPEAIARARGVRRDSALVGGAAAARRLHDERYGPAFALYDRLCDPRANAHLVVDNADFERPRLVRQQKM